MPYNSYDIKFNKLATWITPRWLRVDTFFVLLYGCMFPLVLIHNAFIRYRTAKLYELYINYQVCYLQAFLNDRFDFTQRRIYIDDAAIEETLYIYKRAELEPIYLYKRIEDDPVSLYTRGETQADSLYDFIVFVPLDVALNEPEMRAMVSNNLSGKRYKIERF